MRTVSRLILALGLCGLGVESARAQTSDGLWQRFSNFVTKGKLDADVPLARPQSVAVPRPSPNGAFETRGVVYIEELQGPGSPPKLITAPKAPLAVPASAPKAVPATAAAAPVLPPALAANARPLPIVQNDALAQRLTQLVSAKCSQARNVKVTLQSEKEVTIEMEVRSIQEANVLADQIFAIRELDPYRLNLKCNVPQP